MKSFLEQLDRFVLFRVLFYLIFGVLVVLYPQLVFKNVIYLAAAYTGISGVIKLISSYRERKDNQGLSLEFTFGCMYLLLALLILLFAKTIVSLLPIIFGIFIFFSGLLRVTDGLNGKEVNPKYRASFFISGSIYIIAALLLIFNPFTSILILLRFFGGILIFMSIMEVVNFFMARKETTRDISR